MGREIVHQPTLTNGPLILESTRYLPCLKLVDMQDIPGASMMRLKAGSLIPLGATVR